MKPVPRNATRWGCVSWMRGERGRRWELAGAGSHEDDDVVDTGGADRGSDNHDADDDDDDDGDGDETTYATG